MSHRLEERIVARPGEFEWRVREIQRDNERSTPKSKVTHVAFVCEICEAELPAVHVNGAEGVARRFEQHDGCKPQNEWPKRPGPSPRTNPLERAAERNRIRRELEREE